MTTTWHEIWTVVAHLGDTARTSQVGLVVSGRRVAPGLLTGPGATTLITRL